MLKVENISDLIVRIYIRVSEYLQWYFGYLYQKSKVKVISEGMLSWNSNIM